MPGTRCAVSVCKNSLVKTKKSEQPTITYHTFPKPKDQESTATRNEWIRRCARSDKLNPSSSVICSVHFTENDFERDLQHELLGLPLRRFLKKTAVPTQHLGTKIDVRKEKGSLQVKRPYLSRRKNKIETNMFSVEPTKNEVQPSISTVSKPCPENEYEIISEPFQDNENEFSMAHDIPENDAFTELTKELRFNCSGLLQEHEEFKKETRRQIRALKLRLRYCKNKSAPCKKMHLPETYEKILRSVLTKKQIALLLKNKKRTNWTGEQMRAAFTLRYHKKKVYVYLRHKFNFPLPGLPSLKRWASQMKLREGILRDVLLMMKLAGKSMTAFDKTAVVSFGEMNVETIEEYDTAADEVIGPQRLMQVVMVRGLFSKWKQPVYTAFGERVTKDILINIISELHNIHYNVVACVSDCDSKNIDLWKELRVNMNNVFFKHPETEKRIYVFTDAAHLLKLVKHWLIYTGFQLKDGTVIDRKPLDALISLTDAEKKVCGKINQKHLNCTDSERTNVKLAKELLSNTVAKALLRYTPGNDKTLAQSLGKFIGDINKWFQIFSSYLEDEKVQTKSGYGKYLNIQEKHINEMIETVSTMRPYRKQSVQLFQKGMIISMNSLKCLLEDMKTSFDIHFLLTHKLNLDCLNDFFFQVSEHSEPPTPLMAICRVKMEILGINQGILGTDQNSEEYIIPHVLETANVLLNAESLVETDESISGSLSSETSLINLDDLVNVSEYVENASEITNDALEYIAGYLAKKHREDFPTLGDHKYKFKSDHKYSIPFWVLQSSYVGLVKPTETWLQKIKKWNFHFQKYHGDSFKRSPGLAKRIATIISLKDDMPLALIKDFCKLRIIIRIKFRNWQVLKSSVKVKRKNRSVSVSDTSRRKIRRLK